MLKKLQFQILKLLIPTPVLNSIQNKKISITLTSKIPTCKFKEPFENLKNHFQNNVAIQAFLLFSLDFTLIFCSIVGFCNQPSNHL